MDPTTQRIWMPSGDAYTDAVWFKDAESNVTAANLGVLQLYDAKSLETAWEVPGGVTSICIAAMGCGGGGQSTGSGAPKPFSCGGGELLWRNSITVTPGQVLYVHAGVARGRNGSTDSSYQGKTSNYLKYISDENGTLTDWTNSAVSEYSRASYVRAWDGGANKFLVYAAGCQMNDDAGANDAGAILGQATYGTLGTENTDWRHNPGGDGGGESNQSNSWLAEPRGTGGAAGWTGGGGHGGASTDGDGSNGSGGGAGGGAAGNSAGNIGNQAWGGNTFMWGEGTSGTGGTGGTGDNNDTFGGDGSQAGTGASNNPPDNLGEGGGGGKDGWAGMNGIIPPQDGWVRIIWGSGRSFPSTNVAYPG